MTVSDLLAPNISNFQTFHHLALFICHLFVDGNFRIVHIVHNQHTFNDGLIFEIQSKCYEPIPYELTDLNRPFVWMKNEPTDHILQLCLFDPDNLPTNIAELVDIFAFYRLFVLSATDETIVRHQILTLNRANLTSNSSSLIIHESVNSGSVCVHSAMVSDKLSGKLSEIHDEKRDVSVVPHSKDHRVENENVFDLTFGKNEQNWFIVLKHHVFRLKGEKNLERSIPTTWNGVPFTINLFQANLNTFINLTTQKWDSHDLHHEMLLRKPRRSYKELTTEYDQMDIDET